MYVYVFLVIAEIPAVFRVISANLLLVSCSSVLSKSIQLFPKQSPPFSAPVPSPSHYLVSSCEADGFSTVLFQPLPLYASVPVIAAAGGIFVIWLSVLPILVNVISLKLIEGMSSNLDQTFNWTQV